jgi:hypothetical protein
MNAIEGPAISTIHVIPEDGFSYVSFETVGYDLKDMNLTTLGVERALACFRQSELSIAVHANVAGTLLEQSCSLDVNGYYCRVRSLEELGMDGSIVYQRFIKTGGCCSPRLTLKLIDHVVQRSQIQSLQESDAGMKHKGDSVLTWEQRETEGNRGRNESGCAGSGGDMVKLVAMQMS